MAANSYSSEYTIDCPLLCGGESVITIRGYEKPATVHVCPSCKAKGGRDWKVTFGQAEHYMRPAVVTTYQHRNGLVSFR